MTENTNITPFEKRCEILADLWLTFGDDETFTDYLKYNDLGLPLAYAFANAILDYSAGDKAKYFIDEAWDLFITGMGIEDGYYETLDEMFPKQD
jgi:hypothetical protein